MSEAVRLTSLAHGGGCGCKLAPAVLQEILAGVARVERCEQYLPGRRTMFFNQATFVHHGSFRT